MRRNVLTREDAEGIALAALQFLAREPERIGRFLALSGVDPADLRASAGTPAFQQAVLSHLMDDESLMLVFASEQGIKPERIVLAEQLLGAG